MRRPTLHRSLQASASFLTSNFTQETNFSIEKAQLLSYDKGLERGFHAFADSYTGIAKIIELLYYLHVTIALATGASAPHLGISWVVFFPRRNPSSGSLQAVVRISIRHVSSKCLSLIKCSGTASEYTDRNETILAQI
jgi:hypothetical protein